jgi:hypothetical protein
VRKTHGIRRLLTMGAAFAVAAGLSVVAAPAALAGCAHGYHLANKENTQAQVDNCPGDGSDTWLWVTSGTSKDPVFAWVTASFRNGSTQQLTTAPGSGQTAAKNYRGTGDITSIQLCFFNTRDPHSQQCADFTVV